jgi:hypothetical protein
VKPRGRQAPGEETIVVHFPYMPEELPGGHFTTGELKFASWWVAHGTQLRRGVMIFLVGTSALFWGYTLWGLLDAYAISYPRESRITRQIAINQQLLAGLESDRPSEFALTPVILAQTTDNRIDMSVEVSNPNEQWWAEFNYRFNLSGEQTPLRSGYVLPGGRQVIGELGYVPNSAGGRSATVSIENIRWHRVDPAVVGDSYENYAKKRLDLAFEDIRYSTDLTLGTRKIGQSSFTLVNKSAYGFWSLDLVVRLYRGGSVAATNIVRLTNIQPGERRNVDLVWLDNLPSVTRTEIVPQVNLLDTSAFLPTTKFE